MKLDINILDELPIGIVIADQTGKVTFMNSCLMNFLGVQVSNEIQQLLPDLPENLFAETDITFPHNFSTRINAGTSSAVQVLCRIKKNNDGHFIVSITDVDFQMNQLVAIKSQKNAAENLLRSAVIGEGSLVEALTEICRIAADALGLSRVNIWEFGNEQNAITSLVNFDNRTSGLLENATLYRYQIPNYFRLFETEEIIATADALSNPNTAELRESYLLVHGIKSLIDIPIRISGKMFGLVCFEDTKQTREWNNGEQKFGLFVSQVIALTIETSRRRKTQKDLELILDEKRVLLNEIHRRVRNNFGLIQDLIRTETVRAQDQFHRDLFKDLRNRISSLDMLQRQLYQSEKVDRVNFRDLVLDLIAGYRATFAGSETDFVTTLDQCELNVTKSSIAGLFVNEIIMLLLSENSQNDKKESISIRLKKLNNRVQLSIGTSIIVTSAQENEKMLTSFEMAQKLGSKLEIDRKTGTSYQISFEI